MSESDFHTEDDCRWGESGVKDVLPHAYRSLDLGCKVLSLVVRKCQREREQTETAEIQLRSHFGNASLAPAKDLLLLLTFWALQ